MTPDLDQNLSLKASLHDKVTPVLQKIKRHVKQTREAFSEMLSDTKQTGSGLGEATGDMETKVNQDLSKIQDGLKATSGAFDDFSNTAKTDSGKVGKAIQDAVYTKGAEERLEGLDKDLGKLDKTFKGMASRQGSVSGKARSLAATSSDNINKKVIPAFQELHATLDDYPDILEDINRLEQDRMRTLEEGQGFLARVSGRVADAGEGLKAASEELKYGLRDMAALINAGALGVTGARVQEVQTGAARIAGVEAFAETPEMLKNATFQARTTMEVIEPFAMSMMELQSVSVEVMPDLIADFVNLSKVTGDSGSEIATLHDQLTNLAGIKGEGFLDIQDNMKYFAETTRATWDDMSGVIQIAAGSMLDFSEDARRAYAKSTLAASAAAKNMGLAATTPLEVIENLLDNPEAMAKMQGIISNTGQSVDLQALIREGRDEEAFDAITKAIRDQFGDLNMRDMAERKAIMEMTAGLGFGKEELRRIFEGVQITGEGEGGTAAEMAARAGKEAPGTILESAVLIRDTLPEQAEQAMGLMQSGLIEPGRKLAEGVANAGQLFNEHVLAPAIALEHAADELTEGALSTTIAVIGMEEVLTTGMKSLGKAVEATGMVPEGITDMMQGSGIVDRLLLGLGGLVVGQELITGGGVEGDKFFQKDNTYGEASPISVDTMENVKDSMAELKEQLKGAESMGDVTKIFQESAPSALTENLKFPVELNPRDVVQRHAMKAFGLLPEKGPISPEKQIEMLEETVPGKMETFLSATPAAPLTQAGDVLQAGTVLLAQSVRKHIEVVGMMKDAYDSITGIFEGKKDDLGKTLASAPDTPAQAKIKDTQGEKQVTIQEQMLTELKTIAGQTKSSAQGEGVKPVYTPGVDRNREYLELDKGYS